jgi:hypothetical protein
MFDVFIYGMETEALDNHFLFRRLCSYKTLNA